MEAGFGEFGAYTVDESSGPEEMMGASSVRNQMTAFRQSPSRSLVVLWFVVLATYWFLGYFFKGARKG
jgi:hypothetical protein